MSEIHVPVSFGELLDKISILYVKRDKMRDPCRLSYVLAEIKEIEQHLENTPEETAWLQQLVAINMDMWECNELRKDKINRGEYDDEYIQLTIRESRVNDKRFIVKKHINEASQSELREQKSYPWT